MEITQWFKDVEAQLQKLLKVKSPIFHENVILPPGKPEDIEKLIAAVKEPIPAQILEFYTYCSGLELGDINNGYWFHSISDILLSMERDVPTKIAGPDGIYNILVFARDGGGNYLATRLGDSEEIIYLGQGMVIGYVFDGVFTPVLHLADNFHDFLLRLLRDIEAEVENTPDYEFMDNDLNPGASF